MTEPPLLLTLDLAGTIVFAVNGVLAALGAALACFAIRAAGIRYSLNAPVAPEVKNRPEDENRSDNADRARRRCVVVVELC